MIMFIDNLQSYVNKGIEFEIISLITAFTHLYHQVWTDWKIVFNLCTICVWVMIFQFFVIFFFAKLHDMRSMT